ncbi:bifunctional methylenetetrahydrofolate dehydrogenase/methenyltetrahydrofolate cyclohydrolase FolD [Amphritea opalescens]|nr:bifunctional methylenetetrahydrofolate dehydrogenase/methenyltetrahydrofolate cyclohydrolase FolD [Amphritea opalescens]
MTNIIDGKSIAAKLRSRIANEVESLKQQGIHPGLAVILVGDDPASQVYVRSKGKQTKEAGMNSFEYRLADNTPQEALLELISKLNQDNSVNGILVQLPLPRHIDEEAIINAIAPQKDVDGFHPINIGLLSTGGKATIPCTPLGCLMMLKDQLGDLSGLKAVVLGRSNIVGKPMASLLIKENCTVTIAHSKTTCIEDECRQADILIAAVGKPELVKENWIKPGATIIDVGINRIKDTENNSKLVGDVDFINVSKKSGAITPVPGGVGPMTIACLLLNTLTITLRQNNLSIPKWIINQE